MTSKIAASKTFEICQQVLKKNLERLSIVLEL